MVCPFFLIKQINPTKTHANYWMLEELHVPNHAILRVQEMTYVKKGFYSFKQFFAVEFFKIGS